MRVLTGLLAAALCTAPALAQSPTLVFLVRHAEKAEQPAADPPLTTVGTARAGALAELLSNASIGAVITTPYKRTRETAEPIAAKLGLTIETVPITTVPAHAQAMAQAVRKHAGKAVLVVGHSNTINAIAFALGAPRLPDLCEADYDQLFILELMPTGPPRFVRARYGAHAVDAACEAMR
jgi:broad specificity phosphatase PhoE